MNEIALFLNNLNFNWSAIECVAVFFSILYIILAAKENIWCWVAGAISASLYIYMYFRPTILANWLTNILFIYGFLRLLSLEQKRPVYANYRVEY